MEVGKSSSELYDPLIIKNKQQKDSAFHKVGVFSRIKSLCSLKHIPQPRVIWLDGQVHPTKFPSNKIVNTKYNMFTFLFKVLYNQFKLFFNLFFLLTALTQIWEELRVGLLFTHIGPLIFVLSITLIKEGFDDLSRWKKDRIENNQNFQVLRYIQETGQVIRQNIQRSQLKVGDIIQVLGNQKVPADLLLLRSNQEDGCIFIRTDQLDGETDWKLRHAINWTQKLENELLLVNKDVQIEVECPHMDIYKFTGVFRSNSPPVQQDALNLNHTLWANTVVTSGEIWGLVIYTGKDTKSVLNSSQSKQKLGIVDQTLNTLSKLLFMLLVILSFVIITLNGFTQQWYVNFVRYLILLASIIPISLRVNLDLAKSFYCFWRIQRDKWIPGTIARSSDIPEELGRIQVLLSDKTGTLTQNEMLFKKLQLQNISFIRKSDKLRIDELIDSFGKASSKYAEKGPYPEIAEGKGYLQKKRQDDCVIFDIIYALGLCHSVTPVYEEMQKQFQAASPDEIALVKLAESVNLKLEERKKDLITLKNAMGQLEVFNILEEFPFTSERKRMGIILQHQKSQKIVFYLKGAEDTMKLKVPQSIKWQIEEECELMAQKGLRTLVITQRLLTQQEYIDFRVKYDEAEMSMTQREERMNKVIDSIEINMEYLGTTGVEDKLQNNVRDTITKLRCAGIKIWMLTGDKMETAQCIAVSTGLKSIKQKFFQIKCALQSSDIDLDFSKDRNNILVIDGISIAHILKEENLLKAFVNEALKLDSVICCRFSPTQKTQLTKAIKTHTQLRVACIGDGGNDVGMIQSAHIGIGIVGKEGQQAALASDFSINEFSFLQRLLLWHGRLSYKRSCVLANFVFHRGLIISIIQFSFTISYYFSAISIYHSFLMLGYSTIYTCLPVLTLLLDRDLTWGIAQRFPELYKELQKGRLLNFKSFCVWVWKAIYQGTVIFIVSLILFGHQERFLNLQGITFNALILIEYINVYVDVEKYQRYMFFSSAISLLFYVLTMGMLPSIFNWKFMFHWVYLSKLCIIVAIATVPLIMIKLYFKYLNPSEQRKVSNAMREHLSIRMSDIEPIQ